MKPERVDRVLLKSIYLDVGLILVFQVLAMDRLVSLLFTLTFPLTGLLWLRTVRKTLTAPDLWILLIGAVSLMALLLGGLLSGTGLMLSLLKKWVMLLMTLLYFQAASRLNPDSDTRRFLEGLMDALVLFLLAAYLLNRQGMYQLKGLPTEYLTFRFTNPNLAGLFLSCLYMLQLGQAQGKRWPVHAILALVSGYFILRTQSRNCILVMALYTLLWLFRRDRPMALGAVAAHGVAWFPAIFAAGYLLSVNSGIVQALFRFFTSEGKALSSRVAVWTEAFCRIGAAPLTGIPDGLSAAQLHNSHLDIAASYGVPVLILICLQLTRYLRKPILPGFACCILLGMGESALFSGGLGIYILAGTFLLLAGEGSYETKT